MQHQEKYTLTWHSYSDHLREALTEMMTSSVFADVTLVIDDKQQIRAHWNILSGCSPVFKSILQIDSNNTNPVIYLRGIQHSEMESIMQFIYLGEAKFNEERMSEFLTVSKNLEIKYLSTGSIEMNDQTPSKESVEHENKIADENVDLDEGKTSPRVSIEHRTRNTTQIIQQKSNKRIVFRSWKVEISRMTYFSLFSALGITKKCSGGDLESNALLSVEIGEIHPKMPQLLDF